MKNVKYRDVTCADCGITFKVHPETVRKHRGDNNYKCKKCLYKEKSIKLRELWKNKPASEKAEHAKHVSEAWNNTGEEEKKIIINKRGNSIRTAFANMPEETKKRREDKISKSLKKYLSSLTPEQMAERAERQKQWWASLTAQERCSLLDKMKNAFNSMPEEKKIARMETLTKKHSEWYNSLSDEEKKAFYDKRSIEYYNKPAEEKQEINQKKSVSHKEYWNSLDENIRLSRIQSLHEIHAQWRKNLTEEDIQRLSDIQIEKWNSLSKEEQNRRIKILRQGRDNWWNNLTDEEIANIGKNHSVWYASLPLEEKQNWSKRSKELWASFSDEDRLAVLEHMSQSTKRRWDNISDEEWNAISMKHKEWWSKLTPDERIVILRKSLINSKKINNFAKRFEETFNSSDISSKFNLIREYPTSNNGYIHCWDYGVFDNNELKLLIDLDGSYYHADNCDYDGMHSKEEYDEARSISASDEIPILIIHELSFQKDFKELLKIIRFDYDEYLDSIFWEMKHQPFPEPRYSDRELIRSWNKLQMMRLDDEWHKDLSLNTRMGDRLIQHFHPSIWRDHRKGELSPYQAWQNDDLLRKCIENRVIYQTHLNPNKILQGFNVSKIAPKVSVFSAGRAKMIINQYLAEFDTIFDPFSGYSGRMLGALSLGKRYIGQDISLSHVNESNNMLEFLRKYCGVGDDSFVIQKDIFRSIGEYPCLFTCPPYSDKEQWQDVPVSTNTCDDWINECLQRFKCKRYVFIVDSTEKYKDNIVDSINNKSHFSNAKEFVILIQKEVV